MGFKDLIGQAELRRALEGALRTGAVSHAVLISGPPGSGKKSWGLALAEAVLCMEREGRDSCGRCLSCRQFRAGCHPDFFHLRPEGRRLGIDQIRRLRGRFFLEGDSRVCLIEEAELMTAEASASLLKILEEPPPRLYFILLSGRPRQLPRTIVSRCQRFTLRPLTGEEMVELLRQRQGLSPEKALLLSRLSKGLPGVALELAEDPLFEKRIAEASKLAYSLAACSQTPRELLFLAESLSEREDLSFFLELLCLFYRDALIYLLCGSRAPLLQPSAAERWAGVASAAALEEALALLQKLLQELGETNVNRRLALEGTLLQLKRRFASCPG
ncbi:MAG: DNA polymerase III subunit delta' [Firmicutes bacterium]|jgi:DNA polymerase-3 subunit delta'|nr:DNA polymerase III subunit delta' [Bacillota bacterium]HPU02158.1 DNA polymerase III subunit delta' [Bacillota bacterium]